MITESVSQRLNRALIVFGITGSRLLFAEDDNHFSAADVLWYEQSIKPVLDAHCLKCHGGKQTKSGLSVASRAALIRGGEAGPAVNLSKPMDSLFLKMISYCDENHQMPPKGRLPAETISLLTTWISKGLPWTPEALSGAPSTDNTRP